MTIDAGNGSAGAVNAVATGAYDAATADIAALIAHNINNPARRLIATGIQYDRNPNALIVKTESPIREPRDFIGKKVAGQPFNASRAMFPAFARATGIPADSVQWQNVAPDLGFQLFIRGDVDAVAFFSFTGTLGLKLAGFPPERLRTFLYADYGVRSYGNAIIVNPRLVAEQPRALSGLMRGIARGWLAVFADLSAGTRVLKARDGLIDEGIERERLELMLRDSKLTPDVRAHGYLAATRERLAATIEEAVLSFNLNGTLSPEELFTDRFLPPMADRRVMA
ncbi:ABC transporter substrate-binding protein [Leptolyngbya sp. 15MV]|nr:ABC transporter substrate-binding protein [Leptolyngbya sp. 15MV]